MTEHRSGDSPSRMRTALANERTLLAYVRTSIMLAFSGISAIKIFPNDRVIVIIGLILIPLALGAGLYGYWRFVKVRDRIGD
jgi:putative membrane protein